MIESRLDPLTDGYGDATRTPDLTVAEIAAQFRFLAAEGRGRSASAVLRIVAEQSVGRNGHTQIPLFLWAVAPFATLLLWGLAIREPQETGGIVVAGVVFDAACALVVWATRDRRRRVVAQLDEIRRLAIVTLDAIVSSPGFAPKPLDKEDRRTFGSLRQSDPVAWNRVAAALAGGME